VAPKFLFGLRCQSGAHFPTLYIGRAVDGIQDTRAKKHPWRNAVPFYANYKYQNQPHKHHMSPAHKTAAISIAILILILINTDMAAARPLTIEDLFIPFEYLNIEKTYDRYSALIDLLIFTLIFVGLAQATLAHRYPGPGGRAIAIGVGLSLAISLVIAEAKWDFNLKTLGPLAASIVMLVLAVMIYQFLHTAGMTRLAAAGVAYLMAFFGMTAAAPGLFDWLNDTMPILSALAVIGLLAALLGILQGMQFHPGTAFHMDTTRPPVTRRDSPRREERATKLRQEAQYIKKGVAPVITKELETEYQLESDLKRLRDTIKRATNNPEARRQVGEELERIATEGEAVREEIRRVWELNKRLQEFDRELFNEDYIREVEAMNPTEQDTLKKDMQRQLRKITAEKQLQTIQARAAKHLETLRATIQEVMRALNEGRTPDALGLVDQAIRAAQAIGGLARQAKTIENALLKLTNRQEWTTP
jgi:hypothetical protein